MNCDRFSHIDGAAFAVDPRDPEFEAFRAHLPECSACSAEVAGWIALREQLGALDATEGSHPEPEALAVVADGRPSPRAERHLEGCVRCRVEANVIARFELQRPPSPAVAGVVESSSWLERLREAIGGMALGPALAGAAVASVAFFVWRSAPEVSEPAAVQVTVTVPESVPEPTKPGVQEFAAAAPGEPETVVRAGADPIPDDDPVFDLERPTEIGFNDTGFPGFSETELAGMPEPSLTLEPLDLGDPLEAVAEVDDDAPATPDPDTERAPRLASSSSPATDTPPGPAESFQIAALLPGDLPRYVPDATLAGGSLDAIRMGSRVRGSSDASPRLQVMAPNHVAPVASATPRLYWHLSDTSEDPVEITLVARDSGATLLERRLDPPVRAGLHALDLATLAVALPPKARVDWYVALVVDDARRDLDILAQGTLRFVALSPALEAEPGHEAHAYAGRGYWIDAFAQLSRWLDDAPNAAGAEAHRASLLDQAGLDAL